MFWWLLTLWHFSIILLFLSSFYLRQLNNLEFLLCWSTTANNYVSVTFSVPPLNTSAAAVHLKRQHRVFFSVHTVIKINKQINLWHFWFCHTLKSTSSWLLAAAYKVIPIWWLRPNILFSFFQILNICLKIYIKSVNFTHENVSYPQMSPKHALKPSFYSTHWHAE